MSVYGPVVKVFMAGHSKWNNIKNKKAATDSRKAKAFAQYSKLIRIAVKEGKSDNPQFNPSLRVVMDKARSVNMPKEKIQKALDKGMGRGAAGAVFQEVTYEAFGPGGAALIIHAVTDNHTRSSSDIKFILTRNGGTMAGPGSAKYMFTRSADGSSYQPTMPLELSDADAATLASLVAALEEHDDVEEVFTSAALSDAESEASAE
jgi:transcriptional/translational regulatory protein YebC/TACO1